MSAVAAALVLAGGLASPVVAHAEPPPPPAPSTSIDKDGTFAVGKDIAPGTYRSAGPVESGACYWKRQSGDKVVDNALTKQPQVVEIEATDTTFTTRDCQPWQLADCGAGCAPTGRAPGDVLGDLAKFLGPRLVGPPPTAPR